MEIATFCVLWLRFEGLGCIWGTVGRQGGCREGSKMTFDRFLMDLGFLLEVLWGPFGPHVCVFEGSGF